MPAAPQHRSLLRSGDHGPRVRAVREQLEAAGQPAGPSADPEAFDEGLKQAVRAFQQQHGLGADGIVGPETSRALDAARWRLGDRLLRYVPGHLIVGDDVADLQARLLRLGLLRSRADGVLGPETERALRDLQAEVGLVPDGTCGPDTLRALAQLARTVSGGDATALREREVVHTAGTSLAGRVVVLDPGHGGDDTGAVGHGLVEADVVLDLAGRLERRLAASGVTTVLTRGASQNPSPVERAALAGRVRADVVLSLHCDAVGGGPGRGVATFSWGDPRSGRVSPTGARLADLALREIVARTDLVDCRSHPAQWDLLRLTRMPAVRIELGYLSDPGDARRLADPEFRDTCAEALLVAVQRLYLPEEEDATTGMLRVDDVMARVRAAEEAEAAAARARGPRSEPPAS